MVLLVLDEAVEGVEVVGGGGGKGGELEVVCVIVAGSSVASMLLSLFDLRLPVRSCSIWDCPPIDRDVRGEGVTGAGDEPTEDPDEDLGLAAADILRAYSTTTLRPHAAMA